MNKKYSISLSEPQFSKNEIKNVVNCIKSGWISANGIYEKKFEKKISKFTRSKFTVLCSSGSAALLTSLKILKVNESHEVIVPTVTFISTINSIVLNNASPIFMDCDEKFNIDVFKTIKFIKTNTYKKKNKCFNKRTHKQIKAIIIVHCFGNAVDLENLIKICKKKNIILIEDAAESIGTKYTEGKLKNKHTGTIGDIGIISFNGNKLISTGGGGAILTNKRNLMIKARHIINQAKIDSINFYHDDIGFNFKYTNLQSAIGIAQINKIHRFIKIKNKIYNIYKKEFLSSPSVNFIEENKFSQNNNWINVIRFSSKIKKKRINKLILELKKKNVYVKKVWYPNHLQIPFRKFEKYKIQNARKFVDSSLLLPSSINLKKKDQIKVIKIINKI